LNILTFDIEEWFHLLDHPSTKSDKEWSNFEYRLDVNMNRILNLLENKKQKATFFCLGWVAEMYPNIIKQIDSLGYEIATHSSRHQLAYEQTKKEFSEDLHKSICNLENITGKKTKIYRAPGFSIKDENKWVFDEIINQGIEIDCSIFPAKRAHGGFEKYGHAKPSLLEINNRTIKEFPINLLNVLNKNVVFSGGGYFRLIPYPIIKQLVKRSDYVMSYFHPRDFDFNQPMIEDLSAVRKFKSYYGLKGSISKLEKLITDFEFIDINEANKRIDWNNVKKINI
jgi:polysaccharide deacetylase family protein (PEP-CTERM system associated)